MRPVIESHASPGVIHSGRSRRMRPSRPMITRVGSCNSRHQVTSVRSPNVQHMTRPDPLSGSAASCAMTGSSTPYRGEVTVWPKSPAYRSSSGCAMSATQAAMSSGRVVSMCTGPAPSVRSKATRW